VRLKSITLEGFKSFPARTRLDFGPGVSVVVGPNGSGKSNVTDAVLWAMGEQSPLAVRGQSMQDVIFGGGRGVQPRSAAEVEIVLDNSAGEVDVPFSEISISRRLERNGEGGYRLNGARCRLSDVIEVLSDTGLGKETHSVISQGRVDAIVISKPRDRRMLIEEAAGLGKHRKRRRRAQLKLERTQDNLDRALDVEREARTRLRPLKRQAEAAELHARLQLQMLQVRLALAQDALRARAAELARAEQDATRARSARAQVEARLQELAVRRSAAELALAERAERHDELAGRSYRARSAGERLALRAEQVSSRAEALRVRIERAERELHELGEQEASVLPADAVGSARDRARALQAELAELESSREQELEGELEELTRSRAQAEERAEALERVLVEARAAREGALAQAESAREHLGACEREARDCRRELERIGAELTAVREFLARHARFAGSAEGSSSLGEQLRVREGYELALAAVLGARLEAAMVEDLSSAQDVLDRAGPDGASALLARADIGAAHASFSAPRAGALRLADLLEGPPLALELARRLLANAWLVERLEDVPSGFSGVAVTRGGRVWFAGLGEVRQLSEGGIERVLARRNELDRLVRALAGATAAESAARERCELAASALGDADAASADAEKRLRECERGHTEALEERRRSDWLIEQRRAAPAHGPLAVRRAELEGELAAERRQAEVLEREHAARAAREQSVRARKSVDEALAPRARRVAGTLAELAQLIGARAAGFEQELGEHRAGGEQMAGELSSCAVQEAEIQTQLRGAGEAVTAAEVAAQRLRDQAEEAAIELRSVLERLGEDAGQEQSSDVVALGEEELESLRARLERLQRRREQLGAVNPLAKDEYTQALAYVEELECQRGDLEAALRELRALIRDTDRQIEQTFQETFSAAARNFEQLVGEVFPGGSGRLRLVADEPVPRPLLGGAPLNGEQAEAEEAEEEPAQPGEVELLGVEIELTPAGKSTKRLTLLSGGEKSMTALAFLFAVFLARPCPFYILDEVEAALDDLNLDRFLALLRRYCDRAQFIVVTHQKRTMEAADWLYGVSMGEDGVSKVVSRHLPAEGIDVPEVSEVA
jgi:chromosome segregation protein